MNKFFLILLFLTNSELMAQNSFLKNQLTFERVKNAHHEKWNALNKDLESKGYSENYKLYITAYKAEGKLEIWISGAEHDKFKLFKTYDFCAHSGILGPKVIEGDMQTPEGFYKISVFNPQSNFHLSLGIDYPNRVDQARTGTERKTGGDIYIHGDCVTVGCIPLTDDKMKELYLLAVYAKNSGQKDIPVNIFPFKMTDSNIKKFITQYPQQADFWKCLQKGYLDFDKNKVVPKVIQAKGNYLIK